MKNVNLKTHRHLVMLFSILFFLTGGIYNPTQAQNYKLDSLFGANGIIVKDIQNFPNHSVRMIPVPDNQYLVAGNTTDLHTLRKHINFLRINGCGEIDYSFGSNGSVSFRNGFSTEVTDIVMSDPNRFVACGVQYDDLTPMSAQPAIFFFDRNGKPDKVKANFGKFILQLPYTSAKFEKIHLTPQGGFLISGISLENTVAGITGFFVVKLTAQGVLDPTFGNLGIKHYETSPILSSTSLLLPNGKIMLIGVLDKAISKMIMIKLDSEGNLDQTFGSQGINSMQSPLSPEMIRMSAALAPDGSTFYTVTQKRKGVKLYMYANRFTLDGNLDPLFGHAGIKNISYGNLDQAYGIQATGQSIFVFGSTITDLNGPAGLIVKMNDEGKFDDDFGQNGFMELNLNNTPWNKHIASVDIRTDEKIFIAGSDQDLLLARLTTKSNVPLIHMSNNTLISSGSGSHQWSVNGYFLNNAFGPTHQPKWKGAYQVLMTDVEGCRYLTQPYYVFDPIGTVGDETRIIIQNPSENQILLNIPANENTSLTFDIQIISMDGKLVLNKTGVPVDGNSEFDISNLSEGIYAVRVESGQWSFSKKIVKHIR